ITGGIAKIEERGFVIARPAMLWHPACFKPGARQGKILSVYIQAVMRVLHCRPGPAAGLLRHAKNNIRDAYLSESGDVMDQLATQYLSIESLRLFKVAARKTDMMQASEAGSLMLRNFGSVPHDLTPSGG